ncbi:MULTISPECIES: hypothetical protein [unclassified Amycolatopsis]|uniref:hypothetical protein n=1 Tax=unclassified Amycolatopsis TaxID=2618356 RepID=UPI00287BA2F0|nr:MULTISPECIES: hypothetical protein [unclassified Amycolatopsis]
MAKRPVRAPGQAPGHPLLGWQRLAGNQAVVAMLGRTGPAVPVQRLMVRMPNPFGEGVHNMVGDAEVDEIEESLTAKGAAGAGGKHQWDGSWVFPPAPTTEASVFYGHGNRAKLGGLTPADFVSEASDDRRQVQKDTAFKFVACGGGRSQAGAGAAYGAEVADRLRAAQPRVPGEVWSGALKAAEGLVYYTNAYKTVLPEIPDAIDRLLMSRTAAAESKVRRTVTALVKDKLIAVAAAQRATDLIELRDLVAAFYSSEPSLAGRAASVRAIAVPAAGLSGSWLNRNLNGAMDTMFGGNVGWLDLQMAFVQPFSSGNCLAEVWRAFDGVENDMKAAAKEIWVEFRDELQRQAAVPPRTDGPAARIGTFDPSAAASPDERFEKWQNFGDVLWSQWKRNRAQGGGTDT